jgi:hypothetical protein
MMVPSNEATAMVKHSFGVRQILTGRVTELLLQEVQHPVHLVSLCWRICVLVKGINVIVVEKVSLRVSQMRSKMTEVFHSF